jgi:hypothetical protein
MAIITKPANLTKGTPMSFSLSKSDLAALNEVSSNAYYSDMQNWQSVLVKYKSSNGNQYEVLKFNVSDANPTANFNVSARALDLFEVQTIQIVDFDGGIFTIGRGSLTTADFDVDFNAGNGGGGGGGGGGSYSPFTISSFWGWDGNTYVTYGKDPSYQAWHMSPEQFSQLQVGDNIVIYPASGQGDPFITTLASKEDLGGEEMGGLLKITFTNPLNGFYGFMMTFSPAS